MRQLRFPVIFVAATLCVSTATPLSAHDVHVGKLEQGGSLAAMQDRGARTPEVSAEERARVQRTLQGLANQRAFLAAALAGDSSTATALYNRAGGQGTVSFPASPGQVEGSQGLRIHLEICWNNGRQCVIIDINVLATASEARNRPR